MANDGRNQRRDRWPGFDLGGGGSGGPGSDRGRRIRAGLLLAAGFFFVFYLFRGLSGAGGKELPFSTFENLVTQHRVTNVEVSDTQVTGEFRGGGGIFIKGDSKVANIVSYDANALDKLATSGTRGKTAVAVYRK